MLRVVLSGWVHKQYSRNVNCSPYIMLPDLLSHPKCMLLGEARDSQRITVLKGLIVLLTLSFAKIPSVREINSLQIFLNPPIAHVPSLPALFRDRRCPLS